MKYNEHARVVENREFAAGYRFLTVEAPRQAAEMVPGQFVHVRIPTLEPSALRRPFSVFDAEDGKVTVLYKSVGRGTQALSRVAVGEYVDIEGPLGRGFPVKCEGTALLVGGGFGVAPLHFLAKKLPKRILFVGGRAQSDLLALDKFASLGVDCKVSTNDGSAGYKGFVVGPLDETIAELEAKGEKFELFTCGPDGLLKAVTERALAHGVPGWISVDRHMICGMGACFACIQKTVRGNSRCCIEGPVFKAEELVW